jgi:hypothetical protein
MASKYDIFWMRNLKQIYALLVQQPDRVETNVASNVPQSGSERLTKS